MKWQCDLIYSLQLGNNNIKHHCDLKNWLTVRISDQQLDLFRFIGLKWLQFSQIFIVKQSYQMRSVSYTCSSCTFNLLMYVCDAVIVTLTLTFGIVNRSIFTNFQTNYVRWFSCIIAFFLTNKIRYNGSCNVTARFQSSNKLLSIFIIFGMWWFLTHIMQNASCILSAPFRST